MNRIEKNRDERQNQWGLGGEVQADCAGSWKGALDVSHEVWTTLHCGATVVQSKTRLKCFSLF